MLFRCKFSLSFIFTLLVMCSCSIITFRELEVSDNIGGYCGYFSADYIEVRFSEEVDRLSVEYILDLSRDGQTVSLEKNWEGSVLFIKEAPSWIKGGKYKLSLSGEVQTKESGEYTVDFCRYFYYGEEDKYLNVVSFYPGNDGTINENEAIHIEFNKTLNIASFKEKFNISPYSSCKMFFSEDGMSVDIFNAEKWTLNKIYSVSFSEVSAGDGYAMNIPFSVKFTTKEDNVMPVIEKVCPVIAEDGQYIFLENESIGESLFDRQPIGIVFSKSMDEYSLSSALSIEPSLKGSVRRVSSDTKRFVFIPEESYTIGERYRLVISDSVKDKNALSPSKEYSVYFVPFNHYIKLLSLKLDTSDAITDFSDSERIHTHRANPPPDAQLGEVQPKVSIDMSFYFSSHIEKDAQIQALNSISASPLFPASGAAPYLVYARWSGSELRVKFENWTISGSQIDYYYILKIKGGKDGLINGRGEYMEEDVCLIIKLM